MDESVHARLVKALAKDVKQRTLALVIKTLQSQPSVLAGEDSGLDDVWLQFAVQVQGEQSYDWDIFESHVMQVIEGALVGLSQVELQALSLQTPSGWDWLEARDSDAVPIYPEEIVDELFSALSAIAMDWEDDVLERYRRRGSDEDHDEDRDEDDDEEDEDEDEDDDDDDDDDDEDGASLRPTEECDSRTVWCPGGLSPRLASALSVDQPGSTPMTPGLYRELLRQKLDAMIQADPKGARQVMEMSRDNAPGLWEIAQQNPIQDWASVLMRSDQMTTLLAPVTMNGFLLAKTPQLIHEILELLA